MTETEITSIKQLETHHFYYSDDETWSKYSKEWRKKGGSCFLKAHKRPKAIKTANCLHLKVLHLFHDPEAPNSVSIIVYSVNDYEEKEEGMDKYKCFILIYEYSEGEQHFVPNDISRILLVTNFLVISVPGGRIEPEGESDICLPFKLEKFAILANKNVLNTSITFQDPPPEPIVIDDDSSVSDMGMQIDEQESQSQQRPEDVPVEQAAQVQVPMEEEPPAEPPVEPTQANGNDSDFTITDGEYSGGEDEPQSDGEEAFGDATTVGDSETIAGMLALINSADVKTDMNASHILRTNVDLVKFEDLPLVKLDQKENFNNYNVIGLIRRLYFESHKVNIDLIDEDGAEKFGVPNISFSLDGMAKLRINQVLLIRNTNHRTPSADTCLLVDLNDGIHLKLHTLGLKSPEKPWLYRNEMTRVIELMYHQYKSIPRLMTNDFPTLFGIVLYKQHTQENFMTVGLLLPQEWSEAEHIKPPDSGEVYFIAMPKLSQYSPHFSANMFDLLKGTNRFINLLVYDEAAETMANLPVFSTVFFHSLSKNRMKPELVMRGDSKFRNGRWIQALSNDCPIVQANWKDAIQLINRLEPVLFADFDTQETNQTGQAVTQGDDPEDGFEITVSTAAERSQLTAQSTALSTASKKVISRPFPPTSYLSTDQKFFLIQHPDLNIGATIQLDGFASLAANYATCSADASFRVEARMTDYQFRSNNIKICNMYSFRRELLSMVCSSPECNEHFTYAKFIVEAAKVLVHDTSKMPLCSKCKSDMKILVQIALTFTDSCGSQMNVVFRSPLVEASIDCPELAILYTKPDDRKIVMAFDYFLSNLCPFMLNSDSNLADGSTSGIQQNPVFNLYFRKHFPVDPPRARYLPSPTLFPNSKTFVFELLALESST